MSHFIVCHHKDNQDLGHGLRDALEKHGHKVTLDEQPAVGQLWDGGWARCSPRTDAIILLVTKSLAREIKESEARHDHNGIGTRIAQHGGCTAVVPVVTEHVDLPENLVGFVSLYLPDRQPEVLADQVSAYMAQLPLVATRRVVGRMQGLLVGLLVLCAAFFVAMNLNALAEHADIVAPLFMMTLGALASAAHLVFNLTGLLVEDGFSPARMSENELRIILGAVLGWIGFVLLTHTSYAESPNFLAIAMCVTFLVGFSSRLVISLVNHGVGAIERIAGIQASSSGKAGKSA